MNSNKKFQLIMIHPNHIKGYGFYSDLLGETIFGIPKEQAKKYREFKTEFFEDDSLDPYIVPNHVNSSTFSVPRGKLYVYGIEQEDSLRKILIKNCTVGKLKLALNEIDDDCIVDCSMFYDNSSTDIEIEKFKNRIEICGIEND